jgi:hypothetical protein
MATEIPIACSLDAGDLEQRLAEITAVGKESLIASEEKGEQFLLRFRADAGIRQRLERIVAAEAECCAFLDLALTESGGELVLSVGAPQDAREFVKGFAGAFAPA